MVECIGNATCRIIRDDCSKMYKPVQDGGSLEDVACKYLLQDDGIDVECFKLAICRLDPSWTSEQLSTLVASFKSSGNGAIDPQDFRSWLQRFAVHSAGPQEKSTTVRSKEGPAVSGSLTELPDLTSSALKFDHFDAIYRLPVNIDGAPNFRHISDDLPVFGTGQPTLAGFTGILDKLRDE